MNPYPKLDVRTMIGPILKNYNQHVLRFTSILDNIACQLIYDGPDNFHDHIRDKTVYACSVRCSHIKPSSKESPGCSKSSSSSSNTLKKVKVLKNVFPIMIGSTLDIAIRKKDFREFPPSIMSAISQSSFSSTDNEFHLADIACTFFIINGCVRQLPYFFTNDPTNTHIIQRKIVRCYTYDADDRGKELNLYMSDVNNGSSSSTKHKRGDIVVVLNDGSETTDIQHFFDHCPYPVDQEAYMLKLYQEGQFDIDHLANKTVVSPGHLFVKLFMKYLYQPLKERQWPIVKSKSVMVTKSIESGTLLHVLSRKTLYFKESTHSASKMVSAPRESHREIGMNGEIYIEKNTGCYREVSMQTYPLNPYLSHLIVRQISSKVKKGFAVAFHPSYVGYFCIVGSFETKHVGRTNMMVRDTFVSTCDDVNQVYRLLHLTPITTTTTGPTTTPTTTNTTIGTSHNNSGTGPHSYFVVINEACIPVTRYCFEHIRLENLKNRLKFIECFQDKNFIVIRYKIGLIYRRLIDSTRRIWVTARDEPYWRKKIHPINKSHPSASYTYNELTSYLVDLNPFFKYNIFTKNILAFNTLKNAVLATDSGRYSEYFLETLSAYSANVTPHHRIVCEPVDSFSSHFVLRVPLIKVAYMSFKGMNQEDCIVVRNDLRVFDCYRFYTVRIRFEPPNDYVTFHPMRGDPDESSNFLGYLICHQEQQQQQPFEAISQTTHVKLECLTSSSSTITVAPTTTDVAAAAPAPADNKIYKIYFSKSNFEMVGYHLTKNRLSLSLRQLHVAGTGDKLCSFHGQKGVMRIVDSVPTLGEKCPDIIVNPYNLFRMTCGQIKEGIYRGGRDVHIIQNSDGELYPSTVNGDGIFLAETFYFPVAYWASEHIYAPRECVIDKILGQAVKGRSRGGGMRLGNMEIMNGLRGNGLAACFEEKVLEHGDRIFVMDGIEGATAEVAAAPLPKSTLLCREDAKFYKCNIDFKMEPYMIEQQQPSPSTSLQQDPTTTSNKNMEED